MLLYALIAQSDLQLSQHVLDTHLPSRRRRLHSPRPRLDSVPLQARPGKAQQTRATTLGTLLACMSAKQTATGAGGLTFCETGRMEARAGKLMDLAEQAVSGPGAPLLKGQYVLPMHA